MKSDAIRLVLAEAVLSHLAGEGGGRVVVVQAAHVGRKKRGLLLLQGAGRPVREGETYGRVEHARAVPVTPEKNSHS